LRRIFAVLALLFAFSLYSFFSIFAQTKEECQICHDQPSLNALDNSVHVKLSCVACHKGVRPEAHETKPGKVNCGICHPTPLKSYKEGVHGKTLEQNLKNAPDCQDCHGAHDIRKITNEESKVSRINLPGVCGKCHPQATGDFARSIHGKLLIEEKMEESLTCSDCHHSHATEFPLDAKSLTSKANIPQLCSKCHTDSYEEYKQDVHGRALERGILRSATCTDCHGAHNILGAGDTNSTIYPANISKLTCSKCHLQEKVVKQFGVTEKKFINYHDPYHGVEVMAGDKRMPDCSDCHSAHNIRTPSDTRSTVSKENLPKTCAKCHTGAGVNFAKGKFHFSDEEKGVAFIRFIYTLLIILIIGGMVLHNALDLIRHAIRRYKESSKGSILRFTLGERFQHLLLFITFTLLAYTGFVLRFPDLFLFSWIAHSATNMGFRAMIHRIAGSIFIILCLYNLYYILFTARGREQLKAIFPVPDDLLQVINNVLCKLGLRKTKPNFDHYDYGEKAEYWALVWGGFVMIVTGMVLWFPNLFLKFIPKWFLDVFKSIHFYEALLASLAIIVWHFYFVFFSPEVYPVNWGMLTGRITKKELEEKHPIEYERLKEKGEIDEWG
jgi:formate dehydrogenase gamma subunit